MAATAPDAAPARRLAPAWSIVFWATAVLTALPLFATKYVPLTDVPEHVAVIATLARLLPGGGGAPYELALGDSQYLLFHAVGAVLARAIGDAVLANKLLFALVALMWPVSARSLLRAVGRDERLAIFAAMVFWNRATIVGLEPYVASVPLALFGLATVVRQLRGASLGRAAAIAAIALAVFYTHASAFVLFTVTAAALVFVVLARDGRTGVRRALATLAALVPSAILAVVWWRAGSLTDPAAQPQGVDRMSVSESLGAMPIWTFDVWRSHVDEIAAGIWWTAYAVVVVASWNKSGGDERGEPEHRLLGWTPFACAAAVYLTTPFRIGGAAMLNVRLAPVLTILALVGLRLRKDRLGTLPLAMAAFAAMLTAGNAAVQIRAVAREKIGDLDAVLSAMAPGTRVAMLNFDRSSPRTHFWPYPFAGSYHRARGGAVASYSFVELPHWPVHYARGHAPPDHGPFWSFRPCAYRYREDGAFYDYVLVQGAIDPWDGRQGALGPLFVAVARAGVFTLYGKADGPPVEGPADEPDHGPCRPRRDPRPL